jgi:hypothetical protein
MAQAVNQSPGGCGCGPTCASPTFTGTITGCNSLVVPGITVEAHDATAGGTLLGSTTTNSSGVYTLSGLTGQVSGHTIVIVVVGGANGFANVNQNRTYTAGAPNAFQWSCGATTPSSTIAIGSSLAAGFTCPPTYSVPATQCAYPWPNVLHGTHSRFGAFTATRSGITWSGTATYSYPGCGGPSPCACPAQSGKTVTITLTVSGASLISQIQWGIDGSNCPFNGVTVYTQTNNAISLTCPPALSITLGINSTDARDRCMACSTGTITDTVTFTP